MCIRGGAVGVGAEADWERIRVVSLPVVPPACARIEARYQKAEAAKKELAGFKTGRGIPDYVAPRPAGRGWIWLLAGVALAETTANGLLLHSASTEGLVANWVLAGLVTAMNVGLLGWLVGDLIFRRMLHAGAFRRVLLTGALIPCLVVAALLHFGFAHYRDAVGALDASEGSLAASLDLSDIDAGVETEGAPADPHPPPTLSVEQAVFNELRAGFLWWRPGPEVVDHPAEAPDDHSLDIPRTLAAGSVGYRAENGRLVLAEDPLAGRFEGWRSVLLLAIGFVALALAAWKWFGGREPIPHFDRLHRRADEAGGALEQEYAAALREAAHDEAEHWKRLGDAEAALAALSVSLRRLHGHRRRIVGREEELLRETASAAARAVDAFRQVNRMERLSHHRLPGFWRTGVKLSPPVRDPAAAAEWDLELHQGLEELAHGEDRLRAANAAHAPRAAAIYESLRERLAHAARIRGSRRRPSGLPGPPEDPATPPDRQLRHERVREGEGVRPREGGRPRLEVVS